MGGKTASSSLAGLARSYWEARLAEDPVMATALGDRRYDDRLPDISPEGRWNARKRYEQVVKDCKAIREQGLSAADKLTRRALLVDAASQVDYALCDLDEWTVDPLSGPQVALMNIESFQPVRTPQEAKAMVKRWETIAVYLGQHVANLGAGAVEEKFAVKAGVEKVVDELEDLLAKPDSEWALLRPLKTQHPGWSEKEQREFREGLAGAVKDFARPAFVRYLDFLRAEVLPHARPQGRPGISHLPGGSESYARLIRIHTSLDLAPEELHQTRLREVARINGEMELLG